MNSKKGVKKAIEVLLTTCSNAKKDEDILIVTDDGSYKIAETMWENMSEYPKKTLVRMPNRKMHGEEPTKLAAEAMLNSDIIFGCTKFSLFHSLARRKAVENGSRFVNMADYSLEMLEDGGLHGDFEKYGENCTYLAKKLKNRKMLYLTSEAGTDFSCSIEGIEPTPQYGQSLDIGTSSSPPDIECATCAIEGSGNGIVVIDASIPHPELGLISEPIKLEFKDGLLEQISGGKEANKLSKVLKDFNDKNVYVVGEIGLGLNESCRLSGNMLEDEGCAKTCHIALGDNLGFGGKTESDYHLDLIFREPTIKVDEEYIMKKGEIV